MSVQAKALIWAAIIISAALVSATMGLGDGTSFGIVSGLAGAAWGTLASTKSCGRTCWQ